jgi:hypothetical protein
MYGLSATEASCVETMIVEVEAEVYVAFGIRLDEEERAFPITFHRRGGTWISDSDTAPPSRRFNEHCNAVLNGADDVGYGWCTWAVNLSLELAAGVGAVMLCRPVPPELPIPSVSAEEQAKILLRTVQCVLCACTESDVVNDESINDFCYVNGIDGFLCLSCTRTWLRDEDPLCKWCWGLKLPGGTQASEAAVRSLPLLLGAGRPGPTVAGTEGGAAVGGTGTDTDTGM